MPEHDPCDAEEGQADTGTAGTAAAGSCLREGTGTAGSGIPPCREALGNMLRCTFPGLAVAAGWNRYPRGLVGRPAAAAAAEDADTANRVSRSQREAGWATAAAAAAVATS